LYVSIQYLFIPNKSVMISYGLTCILYTLHYFHILSSSDTLTPKTVIILAFQFDTCFSLHGRGKQDMYTEFWWGYFFQSSHLKT
jgi:hypothetical protein